MPEGVSALLRIEPSVHENCFAATQPHVLRTLHFSGRHKISAEALGVVGDELLAEIVGIGSVAIGLAAEPSDADNAGYRDIIAVRFDEFRENAFVPAFGIGKVTLGQIPATNTL